MASAPWRGLLDVDERFKDFSDLATLAAVLWAETPNRAAMTTGQLCDLRSGLRQFGFVAPSEAGPGHRTWDDPATTVAYAAALRRGRHDLVGSVSLGSGVVDMIRFLDGQLASLRLAHPVGEAVRRAILVPPGRLVPGLERLSDRMHRSITRMTRERRALSEQVIGEEARENGGPFHEGASEDYPNPLTREIVHAGVAIRPLRHPREIDEMASCVSTYRDEARVGDLLLYRLRSSTGGSTLGLDVSYDVNGVEICIFQHYGPQHTRVDAPPPSDHRDAASWLLSSLERPDGVIVDRKWRNALYASRRAHARHARLRPSERDLSPTRQRRLAVLDLTHLGCLLGANERMLDLDAFRVWAESLVGS